ncbi:2-C-methyl-D-erythritol 4-phosphate cytidylyltransferase [Prevotella sp. PCHR]|uniref:2-C-methyl-D-erythritol 4-phosphate cytidylyltransferase n=1 Tax=Xylanibacter caecicola TaxID=2736294 RepID=A0ABX2B3J6_9BACT|nr:2-C-methyl-D-erythritol 4-phosphate cytidylyltransferase [Xylanibacter caecicola]NPE25843.1 2-C-methyl-D-erythritol 4-phosphate cytidylyltransferase [Xylanibacter caecicola]
MEYAIIVAGGKGLRMGGDIPKQFLPLDGEPVLMHTIRRFREYSDALNIILVLPKAQHGYWEELCRKHNFDIVHCIAEGGETRFHSVKNGLALIPDGTTGTVGVHDGVRPFPATEVISRCYDMARTAKAVVPVVPVVDTIRHTYADGHSVTVPRNEYVLVQTPQVFDIGMLKEAYRQPYTDDFTDDASVMEHAGVSITLTEGNRENIKITTPFDMKTAEAIINK